MINTYITKPTIQTLSMFITKQQVEFKYKQQLYYIPLQEFKELKVQLDVFKQILKDKNVNFKTY
jgi:hypothetical protein